MRGGTPTEWVEVNIESPPYDQREKLLLGVVDPLIHEVLRGRIGDWHYLLGTSPPAAHSLAAANAG